MMIPIGNNSVCSAKISSLLRKPRFQVRGNYREIYKSKYRKVGVLPIRIVKSNVSSSDEGPTLETLDYTIRIGSTPTFLYFNLYLHSAYAASHYVYIARQAVHLDQSEHEKFNSYLKFY